jgi:hypothetical protein
VKQTRLAFHRRDDHVIDIYVPHLIISDYTAFYYALVYLFTFLQFIPVPNLLRIGYSVYKTLGILFLRAGSSAGNSLFCSQIWHNNFSKVS